MIVGRSLDTTNMRPREASEAYKTFQEKADHLMAHLERSGRKAEAKVLKVVAHQHQFGLRFTQASFSRVVAIAVHSLARCLNSALA